MVSDAERERSLVQELLQFKEKLDKLLTVAFVSNEQFGHSLKEAFEVFINVRQVCRSHGVHQRSYCTALHCHSDNVLAYCRTVLRS